MAKSRRIAQLKQWNLEILALAGSNLAFMVMVVLLACFDNRLVFEWNGVTLNTLVSILSVAMKMSLTFAVAECIGQWKWILFSRDTRYLIDFERIDVASRGPLGSLCLLWRVRGSWVLRLGGLVLVLAIGLDPFSQQLVQLRQGLEFEENSNAQIKRSQEYGKGHLIFDRAGTKPTAAIVDGSMEASIINGVSRPLSVIDKQKKAQCFTESCTWPKFETLGVCHRCNNLTDIREVKKFDEVYRQAAMALTTDEVPSSDLDITAFVLPNGHFLANLNECTISSDHFSNCGFEDGLETVNTPGFALTSFGTGNAKKTNNMQDLETLIWSMSVLHIDSDKFEDSASVWPHTPVHATECGVYYCVKEVEAAVEDGQLTENVTEITEAKHNPRSLSLTYDELLNRSSIAQTKLGLYFPNDPDKLEFKVTGTAVASINAYFQELYTSGATQEPNVTDAISKALDPDAVGLNGAIINGESAPRGVRTIWEDEIQMSDISNVFAALAASMTNDIRDNSEIVKPGRTGTPRTYYRAEWGWLALHGFVLIGGVITWFMTFMSSTSASGTVPAWKSGALAVIGHGSLASETLKGAKTDTQLKQRAKSGRVKMQLDGADIPLRTNERHDPESSALDGRESAELVAKRSHSSDRTTD